MYLNHNSQFQAYAGVIPDPLAPYFTIDSSSTLTMHEFYPLR